MKKFYLSGCFALAFTAFNAAAQQPDGAPGLAGGQLPGVGPTGPRLYDFSVFGDYYSMGLPANLTTPLVNLQSDVAFGASASMGWTKTGTRLSASVFFSPSYTGRLRYSNLPSFGTTLSSSVAYQFNSKWTWQLGFMGAIRDQQRALFSPSQAAQIAATPGTFTDLAGSLVANQYTNPQLASILTSPTVVDTATGNILFGDRYLTSGVNTTITYARSERFQISGGVAASRSQKLQRDSVNPALAAPLLPRMTTGGAQASVTYGLTQRLSLSGNWNGQRSFQYNQSGTTYGGSLIHNVTTSLGYMAGPRWAFSIGGGVGFIPSAPRTAADGTTLNTPSGVRYLGNGSVAYRFLGQTLTAVGSRTVTNTYGLSGGATVTGDLAWNWNRPGSGWGVSADGGYQSFEVQGASTLSGWRGMASVRRMLGRRVTCSANYSVLQNLGNYGGVNYAVTRSAVRLMLNYSFTDLQGPAQ